MTTRKQNTISTLKGAGITLVFFFLMVALYTKGTFKKPVQEPTAIDNILKDLDTISTDLDSIHVDLDKLIELQGTTTNTLKQ